MSRAIVTLIQQSSKILDTVAPKLKGEANKKIAEVKQKIPTKESVKQMMMDEITSKGPELVCSIELKNRIDFIYNKLKSEAAKYQSKLDQSNEALLKLQEALEKITIIIAIIEGIFMILNKLIPILNIVVQTAVIAINFLKGPYADGAATVKLKDLIDKSKAKVQEIQNSIKVFKKKIDKITKKALTLAGIITLAMGVIFQLKSTITMIISLLESLMLKYILMCDVEGDSMEDEDYAAAVDEAQSNLQDANIDEDIYINQDNLFPRTMERIRNANFEVIQYRIA